MNDLLAVIRWWEQKSTDRPEFWRPFFDNKTPFLPRKWECDLPKAHAWEADCIAANQALPVNPEPPTPEERQRQRRANLGR
jgi:hypothetical protein